MFCAVDFARALSREFLHRQIVLRSLLPVQQDQRQRLSPGRKTDMHVRQETRYDRLRLFVPKAVTHGVS